MDPLETLLAKMDRIERMLTEALLPKEAGVTVREFCQKAHMSRTTFHRRHKAGLIRKERGRVPASELRRYLS